ncbi:MsnO8 family LLM class oxidoreductase [Auritidibacter ignavus]|uniref:MsnO8 family LLM class oxidoreductase n=1 Tax=Auritidibacter ignavus TaxID=678932 RepID=UPI00244D040E|nr:MsnO8 family LLM class oxidoreductase [Auritidibacter ignavus]WGH85972.1 MsnO8 family LLM class oxidoreductase [Auritidibacter ignavus]WGH88258.1 MsnO8 family LLM class oxidoreductase [Auritidibacter ignavus]
MTCAEPISPPRQTSLPLSILDRANTRTGSSAGAVLHDVITRAQHAETLGYHRFWVAEHHAVPGIAGSTPAVLMAAIAQATQTIRIGSGGIMTPSHQPLVAAEYISTLEALFSSRIDIGLGSSVGFTAPIRRALHQQHADRYHFPEQLREIIALLNGTAEITLQPPNEATTPLFVLASKRSVATAAEVGAGVVIGGPALPQFSVAHREELAAYRDEFVPDPHRNQQPRVILSLNVAVAETEAHAHDLLLSEAWAMARSRNVGAFPPLDDPTEVRHALDHATARERAHTDEHLAQGLAGTPETVAARVRELAEFYEADEVLVTGGIFDPADRLAVDKQLIAAWG